jgi:hypothetical protein
MKGRNMQNANAVKSIAAVVLALAMAANFAQAGKSNAGNPGIAPPQSQPLGSSYNEWVILAQQWYYSIPTADMPSPARVFGNVLVPPQLPLAGNQTVPLTMKIGQWLFMPICFSTWANTPGDWGYIHPWSAPFTDPATGIDYPTYEAWVRAVMKAYMDGANPTCTIDEKPVQNIDMYRMQTGLFDLTVPEDNGWDCLSCSPPYNLPAGTYGPCLADGWFAILNQMTPGRHTISSAVGGAVITYEITVTTGK